MSRDNRHVGAVLARVRARPGNGWGSWLGLAVVAGVLVGAVVVAAAGARRTESAYPVALMIGVPVGFAAGSWSWVLFARQLGVDPVVAVPWAPIVLVVVATVAVTNVVAFAPGRMAARTRPAVVLRTE